MMKILLLSICFLFCHSCIAQQQVTIGVSPNLPPYVINKQEGIELDIIKSALATQGIDVEFEFFRYSLLQKSLVESHIDGVVLSGAHRDPNTFQSEQLLAFNNSVITFKQHKLSINTLEDLTGERVVSFKGATKVLGPQYSKATKTTAVYIEHTDQLTQVKLFLGGRYNILISDLRIFNYWRKQKKRLGRVALINQKSGVEYFPIFAPSPRKMSCKNKLICEAFNRGLSVIKKNGLYLKIMNRY